MRKALLALLLIVSFSSFAKDGQPSFLLFKDFLVSVDHILYIDGSYENPLIFYNDGGASFPYDIARNIAEAKHVIDPFPSPCKGIGCDKSKIVKYIEINGWGSELKGKQVFVNTSKIVTVDKVRDNDYYIMDLTDDVSISLNNTSKEIANLIYPEKPDCRTWVVCSEPDCRGLYRCSEPICNVAVLCSKPICKVEIYCSEPDCRTWVYC